MRYPRQSADQLSEPTAQNLEVWVRSDELFRFEKCYMNEPLDPPMLVGLTSGNGGLANQAQAPL
jgi:hypothetical protein